MPRPEKFTEDQTLDAAGALVAASGPSSATIAAIAAAIGAPNGSIYHRFKTRDALLGRLWLSKAAFFQNNFADALALVFSWYGIWMAQKPSTAKRTFGHHRVGILAALVNSVSLVVIALLIFWEAIFRLRHPEPVRSTPMIIVALVAVVMNTLISLWLRNAARKDLNVRSAYLHMLGDAISAGESTARAT